MVICIEYVAVNGPALLLSFTVIVRGYVPGGAVFLMKRFGYFPLTTFESNYIETTDGVSPLSGSVKAGSLRT